MRWLGALLVAGCDPGLGPDATRDDPPTDPVAPPTSAPPTSAPPAVDEDGDGAVVEVDCDDADPTRFPGAVEVCDAVDQDCDGVADDGIPTDGAGRADPGRPGDDGVVSIVTVTARTGLGPNDGTDAASPTLCLGEDLCFVLDLVDWNDREVGNTDVHAFEVPDVPAAAFDRFVLTSRTARTPGGRPGSRSRSTASSRTATPRPAW